MVSDVARKSAHSLDARHIQRSNPDDGLGVLAGTTNQDEEMRTSAIVSASKTSSARFRLRSV